MSSILCYLVDVQLVIIPEYNDYILSVPLFFLSVFFPPLQKDPGRNRRKWIPASRMSGMSGSILISNFFCCSLVNVVIFLNRISPHSLGLGTYCSVPSNGDWANLGCETESGNDGQSKKIPILIHISWFSEYVLQIWSLFYCFSDWLAR